MRLHRIGWIGLFAVLVILPGAAFAQYSPGAAGDLGAGMGSTALGQSVLSGTRQIGKNGGKDSNELSPTMKSYCARWPNEGVCRADRERQAKLKGQQAAPSSKTKTPR